MGRSGDLELPLGVKMVFQVLIPKFGDLGTQSQLRVELEPTAILVMNLKYKF